MRTIKAMLLIYITMVLVSENSTRKLDPLGRIIIPKTLRDKYALRVGDEIAFYTTEVDNKHYICLSTGKQIDSKYATAIAVLEELNLNVPDELLAMAQGNAPTEGNSEGTGYEASFI